VPKGDITPLGRPGSPKVGFPHAQSARSGKLEGALLRTNSAFTVGLALAGALPAAPAQALLGRSFVSGQGSDGNDCSRQFPCRHLQAALAATNAGGEIAILDTAGYNGGTTVTIDNAISIVNPGGFEAGIIVPSAGTGIVINAGVNDAVSLRGLTIEGGGVGTTGIQFNTGASLTVTNCVVRHMTDNGIDFSPNGTSNLSVSNSLVADNQFRGILVEPTGSGTVTAVMNRVEASNNGTGIYVAGSNSTGTINVTVAESVAAHNPIGFIAVSASGHAATTLAVFHSVSANNNTGISASGTGATLRLAQSEVTGNSTYGWFVGNGSVIASYGDNYIDGNFAGFGSPTSIGKQ
jgi:Right handed beta helix region